MTALDVCVLRACLAMNKILPSKITKKSPASLREYHRLCHHGACPRASRSLAQILTSGAVSLKLAAMSGRHQEPWRQEARYSR